MLRLITPWPFIQLIWRAGRRGIRRYIPLGKTKKKFDWEWVCLHRIDDHIYKNPWTAEMSVSNSGLKKVLSKYSRRNMGAVFSFDDGYVDQFERLGPTLRDVGGSAVVFWAPGLFEEPWRAWWYLLEIWLSESTKNSVKTTCDCGQKHFIASAIGRNKLYLCLRNKALKTKKSELLFFLEQVRASILSTSKLSQFEVEKIRGEFASPEQIKSCILKYPIFLANHGYSHTAFNMLDETELKEEIEKCKAQISAIQPNGQYQHVIAIPYGDFSSFCAENIRIIKNLGFSNIFTTEKSFEQNKNIGTLGREVINRSDWV